MEISVSMTAADFMEFMVWREDRRTYEYKLQEAAKTMDHLASSVLESLVECGEGEKHGYKIKSQSAIANLYAEALSVLREYQ